MINILNFPVADDNGAGFHFINFIHNRRRGRSRVIGTRTATRTAIRTATRTATIIDDLSNSHGFYIHIAETLHYAEQVISLSLEFNYIIHWVKRGDVSVCGIFEKIGSAFQVGVFKIFICILLGSFSDFAGSFCVEIWNGLQSCV